MNTMNFKKMLLAGTAIVAVGAFATGAEAAVGATPTTTSTISTATAGDTGVGAGDDSAGTVGDAGVVFGAADITVTTTNTVDGGDGQAGAADANNDGGNNGGDGGAAVSFPSAQDGASVSSKPALEASGAVTGGDGGAGGDGGTGQDGGDGGVGGAGVALDADFGTVTTTTGGTIVGGAGGVGGARDAGGTNDGNGGNGGVAISIVSDSNTVTLGANVTGGAGASAGGANGTATDGSGAAAISTTGASATISVGSGVAVTGGAAGAAVGATPGAAGAGIVLGGTAGSLTSAGTITGGAATAIALDVNEDTALISNTSSGTIGSTTAQTANAIDIDGSKTVTALTNAGNIAVSATGAAIDVNTGSTITTLTNTGTIAGTAGTGLLVAGTVTTLNNTNGDITATTGTAVDIDGDVDAITNTGGTITSASTASTVTIDADLGNLTITGGTISNTSANDTSNVFQFGTAPQTGVITLTGVTVRNDGSGAADSGTGVAFDLNGQDAAVTVGSTSSVYGQFVSTGGAMTLITSGTVVGDITTTTGVDSITVAGGSITGAVDLGSGTNSITLSGGRIVGAVTGAGGADTITIDSASSSITGAIDLGAGANVLDINANYTTGGTITATANTITADVAANTTFFADHNVSGIGALTNNGTVRIGVGDTLTVQSLAGTGKYIFDVNDADPSDALAATDFGQIADTGGATTINRADASFNVTGYVATGTVTDFLGANIDFDGNGVIADNSALQVFTIANNDDVIVSNVATSSITNSSATKTVADTLIANSGTANVQLAQVVDSFAAANSANVDGVLEAAISDVAGGAVNAGVSVARQTGALTGTRLAALRSGDVISGMAAGDLSDGVKVWGQAYGQTATQDVRDGISGYDADTYGFVVGIDSETMADDMTVGLALSYGDTEVDSDALDNAKTDIDAYQITLYGDYDIDDSTYISGQLGYIRASNDVSRTNVGGVSGLNASGDFDSDTFVVSAEIGRDYAVDSGLTLTPSVSANYVNYSADGYTETGAGGANLVVGDTDVDVFEIGVGIDAAWIHNNADGSSLKPVLSAGVRHDLIGDEVETTNRFTGGGTAFKVQGFDPAQTTFDIGAGVTYFSTDNWEFSADYGYEFKSDYDAHSGSVKAAYKF